MMACLILILLQGVTTRADSQPPGCTGSGLGVLLFTDSQDVHIGDTLSYSVTVFNGTGVGPIVCDATSIQASIVTPDGVSHPVTLTRTALTNGQSDYYKDVVRYVVRAEDIQPDGTVRATASDTGIIQQNDTASQGGGNQGVNTEVSLPCIQIGVQCTGGVGENGALNFTGSVTNCGNNTLVGVTITNSVNGGHFPVAFINTLTRGQVATFSGSWIPSNPCNPSTATLVVQGTDQFTTHPRTVSSTALTTCSEVLSPGIRITTVCPEGSVMPGQMLVFTGTVQNTGNVTLKDIVVTGDQPGPNTPVFTLASLVPGGTANFSGSYAAPTNCTTTETVTVRASSVCGVAATATASATCTIRTTPGILLTAVCPTASVPPGGTVTYNGTVRNTGDVVLNNVVVVSDRPSANTPVFTVAVLGPGASASYTGTYVVPANDCSVTTTFRATGLDACTSVVASKSTSITCVVDTTPRIEVSLVCPAVPTATGGLITFSGIVSNTGEVALKDVTVVDAQSPTTPIFAASTLLPGASASFTLKFASPADACSATARVTARGSDNCSSVPVSKEASVTCSLTTVPAIAVTLDCPATPSSPGGLFAYTGTVRNTGNVSLTNVVVTDGMVSPPPVVSPTTTMWFDDAPPAGAVTFSDGGDAWTFVTNSPAPFSGSSAHQSNIAVGRHQHFFSFATTGFAVAPGEILVAYVYLDPANLPDEIMLQWNDGSWEHRAYWGDNLITYGLENTSSRHHMGPLPAAGRWVRLEVPASVVGLDGSSLTGMAFTLYGGRATWDGAGKMSVSGNTGLPPVAGKTIFTAPRLAPGETANFTASMTLPSDAACSVTTSVTASANDRCSGTTVSANATRSCLLVTAPAIEVALECPGTPGIQGGTLTFTGTVRNRGNVLLTNVVVLNDRVGATPVFATASLAPGASAAFTGSYRVPLNCCSVSSTLSASGGDTCTGRRVSDTSTATCPVQTSPGIAVTKTCSGQVAQPGDVISYTGTVSNTGNITLTDVTVVGTQPVTNSPVFGPVTLAPGETITFDGTYTVPVDFCGTDTLTARGINSCTELPVVNSVTTTCPVLTKPRISVVKFCPEQPTPRGGLHNFTGTVSNPGNVSLVGVFVVNSQPSNNTPVIGPITLAPGATVTIHGSYVAPLDCCETTDTLTAFGNDTCSGAVVKATSSAICPLLTSPRISVSEVCPVTPVGVGEAFKFRGTVSNTGDVNLTNVTVFSKRSGVSSRVIGPIELAPGESADFDGSFIVGGEENTAAAVILATGMDTCRNRTVTAEANCSGAINPSAYPGVIAVTLSEGTATVTWLGRQGATYVLQCKDSLLDPIWVDVPGLVTGNGLPASKTDAVGPTRRRFYRVMTREE